MGPSNRSLSQTLVTPCFSLARLARSLAALAFAATPYLIRAIRVVVAYNRGARGRYARFVKWKPLMGVWVVTSAIYAIRGLFYFGNNPAHYSR